jgi:protein-tyrosine phosphatase
MAENANVNPLFESVRQAMGLNTHIAEEVPIRLPPNVPIECIQDRLPSWLLRVIDSKTGKTRLAEYFQVPMHSVVQLVSVYW